MNGPAATEDTPTGSRRARKKARTREQIYDAAMKLALARGYDTVTIDDICRVADVARGTFFLHFPTKDALLVEYGRQATAELTALLARRRTGAAAALRTVLAFLVERAATHAELVRLTVREVMARPVALADAAEQSRDFVALIAVLVARGQKSGELRRTVPAPVAAATIASAYLAIVNTWATGRERFDLARAVAQMLDVVLNGLVRPRASRRES